MINFVLKAAVSLSALLLFILQPLYAKHLLPYFGGAASVWTVTMFFFTCVLCVGYLYATWLMKDGARLRLVLHALLALVATVLVLYGWWRTGVPLFTAGIATSLPSVGVFLTLLSGVLFPVLLLASSAVVIQKLYSWHTGENPYPLYALSNAGSLFGLLSYPFLLERWVDGTTVVMWWSVGFGVYVFLLFFAIVLVQRRRRDTLLKERMRVTGSEAGLWTSRERAKVFLLSAVPALVLVALTDT
ncbi:hypothetical protein K2Q16_04515 [Patescibacteria group bacterium]|nr:hypothetical protein [Patescibacteria group bacterium]